MKTASVPRGTLHLAREWIGPGSMPAWLTAHFHQVNRERRTQRLRAERSCMPRLESGTPVWVYMKR